MTGYVITVDFLLYRESRENFLARMRENAALSRRKEKGCRCFDVCVPRDGSARVFLYEIYDDEAALKRHLETPHFKSFATATASMVRDRKIVALDLIDGP